MKVEWTRLARQDLAKIDEYFRLIDPEYALRMGRSVLRAARFLGANPRAGEQLERGYRKWRVRGTPYVLVYEVRDELRILRLHHSAQNWRGEP